MICQRCNKETQRTSSAQKFCPDCSIIHKSEYGKNYWQSDKGKEIYKRRLELMRKLPKHQPHLCITCGKRIAKSSTFCRTCYFVQRLALPQEQRPNWKGGKRTVQGYVFIRSSSNPGNKGYKLEHRMIWEKVHDKTLPKDWVVHHLNGIRGDNRPNNLVAMPRQKHHRLHEAMAKRIQELEAIIRQQGLLL